MSRARVNSACCSIASCTEPGRADGSADRDRALTAAPRAPPAPAVDRADQFTVQDPRVRGVCGPGYGTSANQSDACAPRRPRLKRRLRVFAELAADLTMLLDAGGKITFQSPVDPRPRWDWRPRTAWGRTTCWN